jgi:SAM-dependent methyltransferase
LTLRRRIAMFPGLAAGPGTRGSLGTCRGVEPGHENGRAVVGAAGQGSRFVEQTLIKIPGQQAAAPDAVPGVPPAGEAAVSPAAVHGTGHAEQRPALAPGAPRYRFSFKRLYYWHVKPVFWHLFNPGATPEDYYARMIGKRLRLGHFHPAIGSRARTLRAPTELLDILLRHGLQPDHVVVDYGCGSFRLGKALIEFLEPGKYWGLDVTADFLDAGMALLEPELKAAKRPNARVIDAANLAETRQAAPRYIISWHVCSKVPPARLPDYFGKIVSLMSPGSIALVHFPEADRRTRQSRFSWAESRDAIAAVIRGIDPALEIAFAPVTDKVNLGVRQTMVTIRRR